MAVETIRAGPNQLFEVINPAFSKGGQYSLNGNYKIGRDEAYVLTLDPLGADYLGFQLADLFGASLDYANHLASLSHAQAAANPDGTITYVLALEDPGVHNWLDPVGLDAGLMMARYQGYDPAKVSKSTAIRLERVVKVSELRLTARRPRFRGRREPRATCPTSAETGCSWRTGRGALRSA